MYLTQLTLDLRNGRQARRAVRDTYQMHKLVAELEAPSERRLLWRTDTLNTVLVQSHALPDFAGLEKRFPHCLAETHFKPYRLLETMREGEVLRFTLKAAPTYRHKGKRKPWLEPERQTEWFNWQASKCGGECLEVHPRQEPKLILRRDKEVEHGIRNDSSKIVLFPVVYEGFLKVLDAAAFREGVMDGIGKGKAFGLGLLSIAPLRTLRHSMR